MSTPRATRPRDTVHMAADVDLADAEQLAFTCPRCQLEATEAFYGPCGSCRDTLRALVGAEARDVERDDYVPKMNVTPNAVATKD